jgi:hypothetical protein
MAITNLWSVGALAAGVLITSCAHYQPAAPGDPTPAVTITFRNQSRDRVQVYLVGEKEDWLLGRLESLETAHLALPAASITAPQSVVLAVIPDWSRNLQPRRDRRAVLSIKERTYNLPGEEWIFVDGQLQGPLRSQSHGRP